MSMIKIKDFSIDFDTALVITKASLVDMIKTIDFLQDKSPENRVIDEEYRRCIINILKYTCTDDEFKELGVEE